MAIEPKRSTVSMDDADGEYNCISAKRRKPSLGKSRGTIDDSGWNVSNTSTWTTATQYSNSILNSTCSIHHDAKDDDASNDGEKTMCDQHLQPNAEYGKSRNEKKRKNNHSDEAFTTCCAIVVKNAFGPTRCYTSSKSILYIIAEDNKCN